MTVLPLDDFRALFAQLTPADEQAGARTRATFERWSAGGSRLATLAARLSAVTGKPPAVNRPAVALFAASHGVARRFGQPTASTAAFVAACEAGHAPVNHLCSANGFGLKVYDLALDLPTGDLAVEPALDERACAATIAFGMEALAGGPDLVVLGAARSSGQEAAAAALLAACLGDAVPAGRASRIAGSSWPSVQAALSFHGNGLGDPLEALRRVGGREFAALAGAIVAARAEKVPVVLDGLAALATAAVLFAITPRAIDHCVLAEASGEAEREVAGILGLEPLLRDGTAAGEGTAGVIAGALVKDAAKLHGSLLAQMRN